MKKYTGVILSIVILTTSFGCSPQHRDRADAISLTTTDTVKSDINLSIKLYLEKIEIQSKTFDRFTERAKYEGMVNEEIAAFKVNSIMSNFVVGITIHPGVPRKDIADFETFLRQNGIEIILYSMVEE